MNYGMEKNALDSMHILLQVYVIYSDNANAILACSPNANGNMACSANANEIMACRECSKKMQNFLVVFIDH
jgi:hypothetical protein